MGKVIGISGETAAQEESMFPSHLQTALPLKHTRSPQDVSKRLDGLINDIRTKYHGEAIGKPTDNVDAQSSDVMIVAHGHILRAFAMRWIGRELTDGIGLLLEGKVSS